MPIFKLIIFTYTVTKNISFWVCDSQGPYAKPKKKTFSKNRPKINFAILFLSYLILMSSWELTHVSYDVTWFLIKWFKKKPDWRIVWLAISSLWEDRPTLLYYFVSRTNKMYILSFYTELFATIYKIIIIDKVKYWETSMWVERLENHPSSSMLKSTKLFSIINWYTQKNHSSCCSFWWRQ